MVEYKITKQLIKKFQDAVPEVSNGIAVSTVTYSNGNSYQIVRSKHETYMLYPISSSSQVEVKIPKELQFVVDKLNDLVQTDKAEENEIKQGFESGLQKFYSEMGWK